MNFGLSYREIILNKNLLLPLMLFIVSFNAISAEKLSIYWVEPSLYFYFEAAERPLKGSSGLDAIFRQSDSALP